MYPRRKIWRGFTLTALAMPIALFAFLFLLELFDRDSFDGMAGLLNTGLALILVFAPPIVLLAAWCCRTRCARWQKRFAAAAFFISLPYSAALFFILNSSLFNPEYYRPRSFALWIQGDGWLFHLIYAVFMTVYAVLLPQWLLPDSQPHKK